MSEISLSKLRLPTSRHPTVIDRRMIVEALNAAAATDADDDDHEDDGGRGEDDRKGENEEVGLNGRCCTCVANCISSLFS